MAAPSQNLPPQTYLLSQVRIEVTRHASSGIAPPRRLTLSAGDSSLKVGEKVAAFTYPERDLLSSLDRLYRFRFFDLLDDYTVRFSAFKRDDGSVGISHLRMSDAGQVSVCVSLADYRKCVQYASDGPQELAQWTRDLLDQTQRLSGAAR